MYVLNIYKSILYNEGSKYSSEQAKNPFNFSKDTEEVYELKNDLRRQVREKDYNIEEIYRELRKLFILRKAYIETPEKNIQDKIVEITQYQLYDKMSSEEIESTIEQVKVTQKFKQSILSDNLESMLTIDMSAYTDYEYSLKDINTEFFDLEKFEDPDVRYYACVVDKNRAGAKPKLVFRLNLAYNSWVELGYLRLKQ